MASADLTNRDLSLQREQRLIEGADSGNVSIPIPSSRYRPSPRFCFRLKPTGYSCCGCSLQMAMYIIGLILILGALNSISAAVQFDMMSLHVIYSALTMALGVGCLYGGYKVLSVWGWIIMIYYCFSAVGGFLVSVILLIFIFVIKFSSHHAAINPAYFPAFVAIDIGTFLGGFFSLYMAFLAWSFAVLVDAGCDITRPVNMAFWEGTETGNLLSTDGTPAVRDISMGSVSHQHYHDNPVETGPTV